MNTKNILQTFGFLLLCFSSSGCQHDVKSGTAMEPSPRDACADYGGLTANLAEQTIQCTGTIGPDSFFVDPNGLLQNRFLACTAGNEKSLFQVTNIIALQKFKTALPRFQECLTDRYTRWSEFFKRTNITACPTWTRKEVVGDLSKAGAQQLGKMQPKLNYAPVPPDPKSDRSKAKVYVRAANGTQTPPDVKPSPDQKFVDIFVPAKTSIVYEIASTDPKCEDPAVCAAQCAAFLPNFVLAAGGTQLVADPASWYRDNTFTAVCGDPRSDDPWCSPDFVHPMSMYSTSYGPVPPGDVYGHPNRAVFQEHCTRWAPGSGGSPGFDYETDLVLECIDRDQVDCLSRCGN